MSRHADNQEEEEVFRPDKQGLQFYSFVLTFLSPPMLWGVKGSSFRAGKWISSCPVAEASGFPALDVWLVPRLGSIGEAGFEKVTPFFLEAEGLTHSLFDVIFGRMLSTRVSLSYHRRPCE